MSKPPIYVTQPTLPPLDEFIPYLEKIWDSKILSNNGPMHQQLEKELAEYLGVKYVALFNNGTNALLTAEKSLLTAEQALIKAKTQNNRYIMMVLIITLSVLSLWGFRLYKAHKAARGIRCTYRHF